MIQHADRRVVLLVGSRSLMLLLFCVSSYLHMVDSQLEGLLQGLGGNGGLDGLGDLFAGLAGAAKQKKDGTCPSVCDGHQHEATWSPAPKPRVRPYSNGCSVPASLRDSLGDYSLFEPCCDLHDACYMACGVPKPYCESQFQTCMIRACDDNNDNSNKKEKGDCKNMAGMFMTGTSLFGCNGYHELQQFGCDCVSPRKAFKRVEEYAHDVWKTFNTTHPDELPAKITSKFLTHPKARSKAEREGLHGRLLYRLFEKYSAGIIEKIASDGQSAKKSPSYFTVPTTTTTPLTDDGEL